jgi:hypothetical protein
MQRVKTFADLVNNPEVLSSADGTSSARMTPSNMPTSRVEKTRTDPKRKHMKRSQYIVLLDINAHRNDAERPNYKYRDRACRLLALRHLIQRFALQTRQADGTVVSYTPHTLYKSLERMWDRDRKHPQADGLDFNTMWKKGTAVMDPGYLKLLEQ